MVRVRIEWVSFSTVCKSRALAARLSKQSASPRSRRTEGFATYGSRTFARSPQEATNASKASQPAVISGPGASSIREIVAV